jgi:mRNA interferase MazF
VRRGDVRFVDFEPVRGSEADERRPAVLVSNDRASAVAHRRGRGVVTVVPLTGNTERVLSFQVLVPAGDAGLGRDSKAQTEQVRAVDVSRIGPLIGRAGPDVMRAVDDALRLHLDL